MHRTADGFFECRLNGQAHAAIENSRCEATVHRAPWIGVSACWMQHDDDATAFGLHHVITLGLCNRVEGQYSTGKTLNEL
jgi:hypothetical protein